MRTSQRMWTIAAAAITLIATACGPRISVRTQVAPDAGLSSRHTFRILPVPVRRVDAAAAQSDDPMRANSITNRVLVADLIQGFEQRGYVPTTDTPDFEVAYYASVRDKLDINTWNYGYTWRGWPRRYADIREYTEGTVIVDVIDPMTKNLLWRGQGVAAVSNKPDEYVQELDRTVAKILEKFPQAAQPAGAGL